MKNIIYSLHHSILTKDHDLNINGRKIGSTKYIKERMRVYQTGYPIEVPLEYYYEINQNCYEVDKLINIYFKEYKLRSYGSKSGNEFYNADELTIPLLENFFKTNNIKFEKFTKDSIQFELNKVVTKKETKLICEEDIYKNKHKKPYEYQNEIIDKTIKYFEDNNKGILVEPCGIGKSLIACWIGKKLNAQSILLGLPTLSLIKQWIITLNDIFPDYHYKVISCEEDNNDISDIYSFLKKYPQKCIFITTYMSSHKILKGSSNFIFDYLILDECHHLTNIDIEKFKTDNKMYVQILKIKSKKQLALTATLKEIDEIDNSIISNNNNEYFGEIIDRRCLYWAIKENILCDYNIHTIIVNSIELDLSKFNITDDKDKRLFIAAYCALKNINDGFSKHLLIYTNSIDNSNRTIQYVNELIDNHYFDIKVYASKYDSTMKLEEQKSVMDLFLESEYAILSSVYCLGEGWDCPKLYGEVFAENMTSNIRIVQSALRAGRKYNEDPNKKFNIIIPVLDEINFNNDNEDFKKIKEIIYQMKQEDETVSQKIIVSRINCNKQTSKLKLTNIKDFGKFDEELTEKIKLEINPKIQFNITYEKAKKIIRMNRINRMNLRFNSFNSFDSVYNKDSYYKLCEIDNRLPLKPDETFKSTFKNWIDYLNIERIYYDLDECKEKIKYYLSLNPEMKNNYLNLINICNELCKLDSLFPPADLWVDYYNIKDLRNIISINNTKKKSGVILN